MDIDFGDPGFLEDPYPQLTRLRERAPLAWHAGTGRWLATSHATVNAVLRDRDLGRFWRDREPAATMEPFNLLHRNQMMENEPPVHTRLRGLVAKAFHRGHVERLRPRIEQAAESLLKRAGDEFDLVSQLAEPLAVMVIAELLGVPESDRGRLRPWSAAIVRMYEVSRTPEDERAAIEACREFAGYLRALRNDDAMIGHLRAAGLTEDEVIASAVLLLNAGHEASVNGLGNGVVAWIRHGAEIADVPKAVEEMLRYDSPLQLFVRTAARDTTVAGVTIPEGAEVAALIGAANRDPRVFPDPDRFDVTRDPNPHLGFGAGLHFCLGAPLARIELAAALTALRGRAERWQLAAAPVRRPGFVMRGYQAIQLTVSN